MYLPAKLISAKLLIVSKHFISYRIYHFVQVAKRWLDDREIHNSPSWQCIGTPKIGRNWWEFERVMPSINSVLLLLIVSWRHPICNLNPQVHDKLYPYNRASTKLSTSRLTITSSSENSWTPRGAPTNAIYLSIIGPDSGIVCNAQMPEQFFQQFHYLCCFTDRWWRTYDL